MFRAVAHVVEPGRVIEALDQKHVKLAIKASTPIRPLLVKYGADWCGPCRAMVPVLRKFALERAGKINVLDVDTDKVACRGVTSIPAFRLYAGGKVIARTAGGMSPRELASWVDGALDAASPAKRGKVKAK